MIYPLLSILAARAPADDNDWGKFIGFGVILLLWILGAIASSINKQQQQKRKREQELEQAREMARQRAGGGGSGAGVSLPPPPPSMPPQPPPMRRPVLRTQMPERGDRPMMPPPPPQPRPLPPLPRPPRQQQPQQRPQPVQRPQPPRQPVRRLPPVVTRETTSVPQMPQLESTPTSGLGPASFATTRPITDTAIERQPATAHAHATLATPGDAIRARLAQTEALRQQILLNEILQPPLALREETH